MGPQESQMAPVPTSNPVTQSGSDAIYTQMQQANAMVQNAAQQLQHTPVYTSGSMPTPTMPLPSMASGLFSGASAMNLANKHPVTAAGQRSKGIGMIAGAAAGLVGKFMQRKEMQKQQLLAQDVHRVMELHQGIQDAQQILQANPNDPAAKAALQKNTALLNSVLNGKNAKDIAKAFDITFGQEAKSTSHEDKQKDMHYKAAQDAMKQMQQDRAKQFEAQQAQQMMVSPAYQRAYAQYQDAMKQQEQLQRSINPLIAATLREQGAKAREEYKQTESNNRLQATLDARANDRKLWANTQVKMQNMRDAEDWRRTTARITEMDKALKQNDKHDLAMIRMGTQVSGFITGQLNNLKNNNTKILTDLDKAKKSKDKAQEDKLTQDLELNKQKMDYLEQKRQDFLMYSEDDPEASGTMGLLNDLGPI